MTGSQEIKQVCIQARENPSGVKRFTEPEIYLTGTLPSGDVAVYRKIEQGRVEVAGLQVGIQYLTQFGDTYVRLEDPPEACCKAIRAFVDAKKLSHNTCVSDQL